jgi:hypothetical protein
MKIALSIGWVLLACSGCVVRAAPGPAPSAASIEQWNVNHPEAARDLCAWVRTHPDAAHQFFEWDAHHPDRSHEFVTWAITHPGENIDWFVQQHPGWQTFDVMTETHRPAANSFIVWCRRHPRAAEALMDHPRGLEWAGNHLAC